MERARTSPRGRSVSPCYTVAIKGTSSSSTFNVAEPRNASTVSQVTYRCSSWSRTTMRSPAATHGRSYSMMTRVFICSTPLAQPSSLTPAPSRQPKNEGAGGAVGERAHHSTPNLASGSRHNGKKLRLARTLLEQRSGSKPLEPSAQRRQARSPMRLKLVSFPSRFRGGAGVDNVRSEVPKYHL
jgi:hypothetical protein